MGGKDSALMLCWGYFKSITATTFPICKIINHIPIRYDLPRMVPPVSICVDLSLSKLVVSLVSYVLLMLATTQRYNTSLTMVPDP